MDIDTEHDKDLGLLLREQRTAAALPSDFADRLVGAVTRRKRIRALRCRLVVVGAAVCSFSLVAGVATRFCYRFTPSFERDFLQQFVGTDVSLPQTSDFTWEAWFRTNASELKENRILGQTDWTSEGRIFVEVRNTPRDTGGEPRLAVFYRNDGKNMRIIGSTALDDAWHHFALVRKGEGLSLYLDGRLEAETSAWAHGLTDGVPFIFAPAFDGLLSEVRVWNIAKQAKEIVDLSCRPIVGSEPGLVGYWPLSGQRPLNRKTGVEGTIHDGGNGFVTPCREDF